MLLAYIIIFSIIGGIAGFLGAVLIVFKFVTRREQVLYLVSFAAGAMLSAAFFDLIPEAILISSNISSALSYVLFGIIIFYCLEKFLIWHHCHRHAHGAVCETHIGSRMVIAGDTLHNFLDGVAIAAAFSANVPLGVITSFAVFAHEIPQEVGDIGVLLHDGFSRRKALFWNLISALVCVGGAIAAYFLLGLAEMLEVYFIALAAGGFIYIATSDLLPEIHREMKIKHIFSHTIIFLSGIIIIWLIGRLLGG